MCAWVTSTVDELARSTINVDSAIRMSPVDTWIGSRVRIKRTMHGLVAAASRRKQRRLMSNVAVFIGLHLKVEIS